MKPLAFKKKEIPSINLQVMPEILHSPNKVAHTFKQALQSDKMVPYNSTAITIQFVMNIAMTQRSTSMCLLTTKSCILLRKTKETQLRKRVLFKFLAVKFLGEVVLGSLQRKSKRCQKYGKKKKLMTCIFVLLTNNCK